MIIKSFQAATSSAALKMVRAEMGGDAVVLKTSKATSSNGTPCVEVTACLDKPSVDQAGKSLRETKTSSTTATERTNRVSAAISPAEIVTSSLEEKIDRLLSLSEYRAYGLKTGDAVVAFTQTLRNADFSERWIQRFVEKIVSESSDLNSDELTNALTARLESLVSEAPVFQAGDQVAVVGLPGSGKTSLIGALAWQLTSEAKQSVKLATLDSNKIGARDEIACFSELLGVDIYELSGDDAQNPDTSDDSITLVDTSALAQSKTTSLSEHLERMNTAYRVLVVSSLTRTSDLLGYSESFAQIKPTHIAVTMTDLTSCLGGVIELAEKISCKLTWQARVEDGSQIVTPISVDNLITTLRSAEVRHA